jgi:hypothetical protein
MIIIKSFFTFSGDNNFEPNDKYYFPQNGQLSSGLYLTCILQYHKKSFSEVGLFVVSQNKLQFHRTFSDNLLYWEIGMMGDKTT